MNYRIKLSHLSIDGFRGFGQPVDLSFDERLTVLIGANGTGKSTILDALAMGMMYLRSEITGGKMFDFPLPLDPVKNKNYDVNNDRDSFENVLDLHFTRFDVDEVANTLVNFDNDTLSKDRFVLRGTPTTTSNMEGYLTPDGVSSNQGGDLDKLLRHFGHEKLKRKLTNVPILVYYGCNSITTDTAQTTIDGTARLTHLDMFDTYKQSLEAREFNFGQLLLMLDRRQKTILQNGEKNDRFLDALEVAITSMLNDADGATYGRLRIYYGTLFDEPMVDKTIHEKTTHLYLNQLSSGEKYLLGLVADLVRRLYLANTEGDLLHGEGIVLIDEIDLHLHPKWQRMVLPKLCDIFPNVQFVVTTHSPLVLSSIYSEHVRVLDNGKTHGIRNTFGRDANDILDNSMSNDNVLSSSNYETIKKIRHLLSEEKIEEARDLRDELQIEGLYAPLLEIDLFIQRRERESIGT